jgi:hypothetical protein
MSAGKRCIYTFHVDCGRHGDLDGRFVATPEDIAFAVGKTVYFDEPWGKHSGVEVTFEADHFAVFSDTPEDVAAFERLNCAYGECPLGLLHDSISDGRIELTPEQKATAPPCFQRAIKQNAERIKRANGWLKARGTG